MAATVDRDACGSRRGYRLHANHGERPCDRCREANSLAMAEYRSKPGNAEVHAWYTDTRRRALEQLAREFPARLLQIIDEIRERDPKPTAADVPEVYQRAS